MGSPFISCARCSWTLTLTAHTVIRQWETFTFLPNGYHQLFICWQFSSPSYYWSHLCLAFWRVRSNLELKKRCFKSIVAKVLPYVKASDVLFIFHFQNTTENACFRLFIDYHGLPLLWSWMADLKQLSETSNLKCFVSTPISQLNSRCVKSMK